MRRLSIAHLLIALALLARLLAPLTADARGFDPLLDAPICTHDGTAPADDGGKGPVHAGECAATCCHVAPAFFAPPVASIALDRTAVRVAWHHGTVRDAGETKPGTVRARGPPVA